MIIHILNWIMVLLSVATAYLSWMVYRITRARSLLYIFFAMCLGVVTRVLIAVWGSFAYATYPSFVFWALWTIGLYLLLKLLTKYMKLNGVHDEEIRAAGEATGRVAGKIEGKAEARSEEINDLKKSLNKVKKGK